MVDGAGCNSWAVVNVVVWRAGRLSDQMPVSVLLVPRAALGAEFLSWLCQPLGHAGLELGCILKINIFINAALRVKVDTFSVSPSPTKIWPSSIASRTAGANILPPLQPFAFLFCQWHIIPQSEPISARPRLHRRCDLFWSSCRTGCTAPGFLRPASGRRCTIGKASPSSWLGGSFVIHDLYWLLIRPWPPRHDDAPERGVSLATIAQNHRTRRSPWFGIRFFRR